MEHAVLLSLTASFSFLSEVKYGATLTKVYRGRKVESRDSVGLVRVDPRGEDELPQRQIAIHAEVLQRSDWL